MSELSTKRFFPVTLRSNSVADELRMEFQFVGEIKDGQWEKWLQRLSETFLALARAGGLGGKRHAPRIRDTFFDNEWHAGENEIGTMAVWAIQDLVVAPEALRVLVNLAESAMYDFENILFSLDIFYGSAPLEIESIGLPAQWMECPFEVEEYFPYLPDFDIELVLAKPFTRERVHSLCDPVDAWFNTVKFGGFGGHPYAQWKPGLEINEKLVSIAGKVLVLHIHEFYAQPDAMSSLINVLIALNGQGEEIHSVVIGE